MQGGKMRAALWKPYVFTEASSHLREEAFPIEPDLIEEMIYEQV
jgi:hypothetical protein